MLHVSLNGAALAVAVLFYTWRSYSQLQQRRQQRLRERVAFMLWAMAGQVQDDDTVLTSPDFSLTPHGS